MLLNRFKKFKKLFRSQFQLKK